MQKIYAIIRSPTLRAEVCRTGVPQEADYDGAYTITPKTVPQTLETKKKRMTGDLLVLAIPYYETSNQNGTTVIIGG